MMIGTSGRRALALGRSSRPVIPGMLMSERIKIRRTSLALLMPCSASGADRENSMLKRPARRSRRNCWRNSTSTSGSSSTTRMSTFTRVLRFGKLCRRPRQNNSELRELPSLGIDLYRSGMLLDDDVMADRQPKPSSFPGWLGREEGVEHLFPDLSRYAGAIIANLDLDAGAKTSSGRCQDRLVAIVAALALALGCCIKPV